jgi:hypothetical protein
VSERFWDRALQRLEEGTLVPILGPDLLAVEEGFLYPLLAKRLARHLGVPGDGLPPGSEVAEVSRRFLAKLKDARDLYRGVRAVLREMEPIAIPEPLLSLARIPKLGLFVTTTFDVLAERAVDQVRFDGQRQTLAFSYAPNDRQDLPPEFDRLGRPGVFHLLGRVSGTPGSFAVTREDTLEFLESLQNRPPGFLFDKLRASDLLILGCPHASWLTRVLAQGLPDGEAPAILVERASGAIEAAPSASAPECAEELESRFREISPRGQEGPAAPVPAGAVLLSAVEADRAPAESLRIALDRAGIDVVLDLDDAALAPAMEKRLKASIGRLAAFAPLISKRSAGARRRFLRTDWVEAILEAEEASPSGRFVVPLAVDESEEGIPAEFGDVRWEKLPGGEPSSELVKSLIEIQRRYRRARSG